MRAPLWLAIMLSAATAGCLDVPGPEPGLRIGFEPPERGLLPGEPVTFTAHEGPLAMGRVQWSFGDGATAQGPIVTHAFNHGGAYHVKARAGFTHDARWVLVEDAHAWNGTAPPGHPVTGAPPETPARHAFPAHADLHTVTARVDANLGHPTGRLVAQLVDPAGNVMAGTASPPPIELRADVDADATLQGEYALELWVEPIVVQAPTGGITGETPYRAHVHVTYRVPATPD